MYTPTFTEKIATHRPCGSVATLCDGPEGLTNSIIAAREWLDGGDAPCELYGYESFEEAGETVVNYQNDLVIVAGAYSNLKKIYYHENLIRVDSFTNRLPDFVLGFGNEPTASVGRLYYHDANESLIEHAGLNGFEERIAVNATSLAAKYAKNDPESAAITTRNSAEHYDLHIAKTLGKPVIMDFVIFGERDRYEDLVFRALQPRPLE